MITNYYITPVCKVLACEDYSKAQKRARELHPAGKALPIRAAGDARPQHYNLSVILDTYA